jgi:hypothetical protein
MLEFVSFDVEHFLSKAPHPIRELELEADHKFALLRPGDDLPTHLYDPILILTLR